MPPLLHASRAFLHVFSIYCICLFPFSPPFFLPLHPLPALLLFPSISYHMSRISRLDSLYSAGSASHHLRHRHSRADKKSQLAGPVRHCPPPAILGSCWLLLALAGARRCTDMLRILEPPRKRKIGRLRNRRSSGLPLPSGSLFRRPGPSISIAGEQVTFPTAGGSLPHWAGPTAATEVPVTPLCTALWCSTTATTPRRARTR